MTLRLSAIIVAIIPSLSCANTARVHDTAETYRDRPCVTWLTTRSRNDAPAFRPISDALACYDGELQEQRGNEMAEWLTARSNPMLVIRSPGGPVTAGLLIGNAVLKSGATVATYQLCASSCANYVFGPSPRRVILRNTLVLFHGGISRGLIDKAEREVRKQLTLAQIPLDTINQSVRSVQRDLEQQLQNQRQLLTAAGVDASFLERFETVTDEEIARSPCTSRADVGAFYLTREQFLKLGMPVQGFTVSSPREAARVLKKFNATGSVCAAPDKIIGGD